MSPVITVTTVPFQDPEAPTATLYQQVANDVITALDAFVTIIPKLEEAEAADAKQVRRNLYVPDAFCQGAVVATEQLPELESVKRTHAERIRVRLQYLEAFRAVDARMDSVSRGLKHALRMIKSAVAGDSLEIYRVARAHMKPNGSPSLIAQVETLKRLLAKKTSSKAAREEAKLKKFTDAVAKEAERRFQEMLAKHQQKEVKAA